LKISLILLFLVLLFPLTAYQFFGEDFVDPGSIYTLLLLPGDGDVFTGGDLSIKNQDGRVLATSSFFSYQVDMEHSVWVALLGIAPDLPAEQIRLDAECINQEGSVFFSKRIQIGSREFPRQELSLDSSLTSLRSEPDPRKTQESRMRWAAISSFDPRYIYHMDRLNAPVEGDYILTTDYGTRRLYHYSNGTDSSTLHFGLDWAAPLGTPVYSVASGRVVLAEEMLVTGNTLIIEHLPGVYSLYYHLDRIDVEVEQLVSAGEQLGTMGETGLATGSHLHWEIRVSKVAVDPMRILETPVLDKDWIISKINSNK